MALAVLKGLRLRRIVRIAPGLRINLSKSGGSVSVGGPGASVNLGKDGVRGTLGAPGTGVSYSKRVRYGDLPRLSPLMIAFFVLVALAALAIALY